MEKRSITETIIALEAEALEAWHNGNPSPYIELYSKSFTYFDPVQDRRLEGWGKIKELYEGMRGKVKKDKFEIINPVVQHTDTMAILTYNLLSYSGETLQRENCTEVYRLEDSNGWKIIHIHWSLTNPSSGKPQRQPLRLVATGKQLTIMPVKGTLPDVCPKAAGMQ